MSEEEVLIDVAAIGEKYEAVSTHLTIHTNPSSSKFDATNNTASTHFTV